MADYVKRTEVFADFDHLLVWSNRPQRLAGCARCGVKVAVVRYASDGGRAVVERLDAEPMRECEG